jgi:hypothetical protein
MNTGCASSRTSRREHSRQIYMLAIIRQPGAKVSLLINRRFRKQNVG